MKFSLNKNDALQLPSIPSFCASLLNLARGGHALVTTSAAKKVTVMISSFIITGELKNERLIVMLKLQLTLGK